MNAQTTDITYPVVINNGRFIATIKLPIELKESDAKKICAVIMALVDA
jgi:hypothetical protein